MNEYGFGVHEHHAYVDAPPAAEQYAWNVPRTWVAAEVVSAAIMNAHVRDQLAYLHGDAGTVTLAAGVIVGDAGKGSLRAHRHPYGADRHIETGSGSLTDSGGGGSFSATFTDPYASTPNGIVSGQSHVNPMIFNAISSTGLTVGYSGSLGTFQAWWITDGAD